MSADPTDVVPRKRQGAAPSSIRYKRSRSRSPSPSNDSHAYLHLRGLPWRINESEVREFMEREVRVDDVILVLLRDGRQSGEALVKLQKGEKVSAAMKLHLSHLGRRYVEVRESNEKEWEREQLRKAKDAQIEHLDLTEDAGLSSGGRMVDLIARNYGIILRVRGLPFRTNEQDIREFFSAVKIPEVYVVIVNEECSGDAFLFMNDEADCTRALGYNKKYMGKRYVEVMRSNAKEALEISQIKNRQIHTAKTVLKLKGIPYEATVHDIMNFLAPAPYKPFDVFLSPPGKCAFAFFSEAKHASAAMFLDRRYIGSRYIEVFPVFPFEAEDARKKLHSEDPSYHLKSGRTPNFRSTLDSHPSASLAFSRAALDDRNPPTSGASVGGHYSKTGLGSYYSFGNPPYPTDYSNNPDPYFSGYRGSTDNQTSYTGIPSRGHYDGHYTGYADSKQAPSATNSYGYPSLRNPYTGPAERAPYATSSERLHYSSRADYNFDPSIPEKNNHSSTYEMSNYSAVPTNNNYHTTSTHNYYSGMTNNYPVASERNYYPESSQSRESSSSEFSGGYVLDRTRNFTSDYRMDPRINKS